MSFVASILDSLFSSKERTGAYECPCGAVKCQLKLPASSFVIIEQTNAHCQCIDCVGYCRACPNGDYILDNYGSHLVNFYKSDVTILQGQEKIGAVKLNESTAMVRMYCKECGEYP